MGEAVEVEKKPAEGEEKKPAEGEEEAPAEEKAAAEEGGEKKKTEGEEKKETEGGETKEDAPLPPIVVVLKLDLHCEGCAKKIRRAVGNFEGVEKAKADVSANKLTVTGNVDPASLREKVEAVTRKKVDLISPLPEKDSVADEKPEKKTEDAAAEKPKEPVMTTVVLMIKLHCQGCAHKIKRTILKNFDEVESVKTDVEANSVTVTGTMDAKELASFLEEKIRRPVEVVPPPKKAEKEGDAKESGGGEAEEKKEGGGDAKDGASEEDDEEDEAEEPKMEINKLAAARFNPYTYYAMPMYNQSYSTSSYAVYQAPPPPPPTLLHHDAGFFLQDQYSGYSNHGYPLRGPPNYGYPLRGGPMPAPVTYMNNVDHRMFSDENPYACSVM